MCKNCRCVLRYFDIKKGEIIFSSPKITPAIYQPLQHNINELNALFKKNKWAFKVSLIANNDFDDLILKPIIAASSGVADTSELFVRGYQMYKMFSTSKQHKGDIIPKKDKKN